MRSLRPGLETIHACHVLARHLAAFCLCPENSKTELKSNGLICLVEGISKQDSIQTVASHHYSHMFSPTVRERVKRGTKRFVI